MIGVTYINNDQTTQALGASDPTSISKQNVMRALVRGINARGGMNGRRLQVVEYEWNSQSDNWSQDAATACALFTQDHHVAVVLDTAFGTIGGFRTCLQKSHVLVIQSAPEGDESSSAAASLHASTFNLTADRAYPAVLRGLHETGYLTASSKVGVIVESCPEMTDGYQRGVRPVFASLGLKAPLEATVSCTNAFADAGPAASAIGNDVLRFRSAGVDRVMFVSDNESVMLLLFATSADSQGYRPGYLLSSNAQAQALRSQLPSAQQPQLHGVGHQTFNDVDGVTPSPTDDRCKGIIAAAGLRPAAYADYGVLVFECGPFLLLERALSDTDGDASAAALAAAIASLGSAFVAPGLVDGATEFSSTRHDGPARVRAFGYVASCTCMRYSGPSRPAT
jgi:hypothetical protein